MIASIRRGLLGHALFALLLMLSLGSCTTGGTKLDPNQNLPGTAPSIFGLTKSSANPGETLSILGSNFGLTQGGGTVTIGGVNFAVTAWADAKLDVTVPSGAESGVIIVTQNNRPSQSGQEAQLFVGQIPSVSPVLLSVSPDAARAGQEDISIVGTGFGDGTAGHGVFFTSAAGTVQGTVVTNSATGNPQWTATNIRVLVPLDAITGPVFVQTTNGASNSFALEVLPPQIDVDNITITAVTPGGGPVGTELQISGDNFGIVQGNSRAFLEGASDNDRELLISEWTDNLIRGTIPLGATSGTLHLIISGLDIVYATDIIVALKPEITAVSPSDLRIGKPVSILGKNFGDVMGGLDIGSTAITDAQITSWSNTAIVLDKLPAVSVADISDVPVVVTSDPGISSDPFSTNLVSDIIGQVSVAPITGIATKTQFTFTVNAAGADGAVFKYTLTPDISKPNETKVSSPTGNVSANPQITHVYPAGGTFTTSVKIEDTTTGDFLILQSPLAPTIVVGGPSDVVIVDFGPLDFANGPNMGENIFTFLQTAPGVFNYNDFLFTPQNTDPLKMWFTRGVDDISVGPVTDEFMRDQGNFVYGGNKQRPYGYRKTGGGGRVRIYGYNFGVSGEVHLNSSSLGPGNFVVPGGNIINWNVDELGDPADPNEAGYIDFVMPLDDRHAGGKFLVTNDALLDPGDDTVGFGVSAQPLVVCAKVLATAPNNVPLSGGAGNELQITGFDLTAPQIPGITGSQTYLFFVVQAQYNDPFNGDAPTTAKVLCVNPFPVIVQNTNQIIFDLSTLQQSKNIEVSDGTGTQYQPADTASVTLTTGSYSFFIWSGALPADGTVTGTMLANSGIMSEFKDITVVP